MLHDFFFCTFEQYYEPSEAHQGAGHAIIQVEMELNLHKTLCHFLMAQLQDLEPNVSRKH